MRRTSLTQLLLGCLTTVLALSASPSWGEQTFPYKAYVTADGVYIRSGPGKTYYPTDKVKAGRAVEVYRHDPGGWCAIRPPKGSFTWVSTRYLTPTDDQLAQVTAPRVASRVGSRFSHIRDVIQVRLHEGEFVELLGDRYDERRAWTRIAPPSGEFRWIHGKYLDPEYPINGVRKNASSSDRSGREPSKPVVTASHEKWASQKESVSQEDPRRKQAIPPRPLSSKEYRHRLDDLDLELSIMVAEEPTVWQFDELALEAEYLVAQAETALERGRARMVLGKIERFENIKQRHDAVNRVVADTERRGRRLAALSTRDDPTRRAGASERFDGRGRLTRVRSPKPGAPRYALVDETGKITCYVTPSPGMSLRHYEQRTVGITGTRGYMPEQRAYHVMAKHIDIVGDSRMR